MQEVVVNNLVELEQFAINFSKIITSPMIIGLNGELGSGKTTFVKKIIKSFGKSEDIVKSPSFTLMNLYELEFPILHLDFYRINNKNEIEQLGIEDYLKDHVVFIEWYNKFPVFDHLNPRLLEFINLEETKRKIIFI